MLGSLTGVGRFWSCGVGSAALPGPSLVRFLPFDLVRTYVQPCAFSMCCLQLDSRLDLYGQGLNWHSYMGGFAECLSLRCRSRSFSVGQPYSWYLQAETGHFQGRECVFSCLVKSQGRLNCF